MQKVKLARSLR